MSAAFTPGPWKHVLRANQLGPRHLFVTDQSHKRCFFKTDKPTEQDIADARLIAAAPELYEALEKTFIFICHNCPLGPTNERTPAGKLIDSLRVLLATHRKDEEAEADHA